MSRNSRFMRRGYLASLLGTASFAALSLTSAAQGQTVDLSIDADGFTVADVLDRGTISVSPQQFSGDITASILDGALEQRATGAVDDSSVVIEANQLLARAFGNQSDMEAQLLGDGADGRLGMLSGQDARGTVTANVSDSILAAEITTEVDATGSSFSASDNRLEAAVTVNEARAVFADNVSAELVEQLASDTTALSTVRLNSGDFNGPLLDVVGGSSVVASSQVIRDGALTSNATVNDSTIEVDLREGGNISDAEDSALSVDGNTLRATLTGNTAVAGTNLSVDTLFQGSAAVLNQQQIGDGSAPIALSATVDRSALTVDLGETTDSSISVSENRIGASASGFVGRNGTGPGTFLIVDANQIEAAAGSFTEAFIADGEARVDFSSADALSLDGSFVLGTQQVIAGDGGNTSSITAQALASGLTVLSQAVLDSALDVSANTLFATAGGNEGESEIRITGTSIDASAALGNEQRVTDTSIRATLGADGSETVLSASIEGLLSDSSVAVDSNLMLAQAEANVGRNLLSVNADTTLSRTSFRNRAVLDGDQAIAGFVLSTAQEFSGENSVLSAAADSALSVTVGDGTPGNISGSDVSISDNTQMVMAEANQIENALELSAVTLGDGNEAATSILANRQIIDAGSITARSQMEATLLQPSYSAGLSISGSTLAVDGNENRAVVMGNEATNLLNTRADTEILGNLIAGSRANLAGNFAVRATSVLDNQQSLNVGDDLTATASTTATLRSNNGSTTAVSVDASSLSVSENLTVATVTGNLTVSSIEQEAGTQSGATAALRNQQDSGGDGAFASTAVASGAFTVNTRGNVLGSSLSIDENRLFSSVTMNAAQNTITARATSFDTPTDSISYTARFEPNSAEVAQARADFALLSDQAQSGNITATTEVDAVILVQPTSGNGGFLRDSTASIDNTLARSDALANQVSNRVIVTAAAEAENVTSAIASRQQSDGDINARTLSLSDENDMRLQVRRGLENSSASIDGTIFVSAAGANTADNLLRMEGTSISGATLPTDFNTLGARLNEDSGLVQARGDANIANLQISEGDISAIADMTARLSTLDFGFVASSASINGSVLQALSTGNRASNVLELLADASVSLTAAIGNVQESLADIDAQTLMFASIGAGSTRIVSGEGLAQSSSTLDDNIAVASVNGNTAISILRVEASSVAGISELTDIASVSIPETGAANAVARADFAIGSQQVTSGDLSANSSSQLRQSIRGDIQASAASISGNIGQSVANANQATNIVDLDAGTGITGTAALVNDQVGSGEVSSNTDLVAALRQNFLEETTAPSVEASSISLNDNLSIASARGNDAVNTLSMAGASVSGRDNSTTLTVTNASISGSNTGDALLATSQTRTGNEDVTSSASIRADALRLSGNTINDGNGDETIVNTPGSLTDSSVSASGNFADSTSSANRVRNTLALNADTGVSAGGGIVSTQSSDSTVSSDVRITARVGSDDFGAISGSSVALNSNIGVARASGNDATSRMTVQSGTGVAGQSTSGGSASLDGSTGVLNASADFAMVTNQVNTGSVSASAGDTTDRSLISATTAGGLLNSSVSVSNNALVADATSNRADNRMTVSGRPASENVTVAMANRQVATGPVTAQVNSGRLASASGAVTSSAVRVSGNQFSAGATGNVATTRLTRD